MSSESEQPPSPFAVVLWVTQVKDILVHFVSPGRTISELLGAVDISASLNSLSEINLSRLLTLLKARYNVKTEGTWDASILRQHHLL